jgi:hypothetical protein
MKGSDIGGTCELNARIWSGSLIGKGHWEDDIKMYLKEIRSKDECWLSVGSGGENRREHFLLHDIID